MHRYVSKIDPEASIDSRRTVRQQNIRDDLLKKRTTEVQQLSARSVYEAGILFMRLISTVFDRCYEFPARNYTTNRFVQCHITDQIKHIS